MHLQNQVVSMVWRGLCVVGMSGNRRPAKALMQWRITEFLVETVRGCLKFLHLGLICHRGRGWWHEHPSSSLRGNFNKFSGEALTPVLNSENGSMEFIVREAEFRVGRVACYYERVRWEELFTRIPPPHPQPPSSDTILSKWKKWYNYEPYLNPELFDVAQRTDIEQILLTAWECYLA